MRLCFVYLKSEAHTVITAWQNLDNEVIDNMAHVKTGELIRKCRFQDQGLPSLGRYVHVPHSHGCSQSGKGSSRPLGPALAQEPHRWTGASFAPVEILCLRHVVCISVKNNSYQSEKMNAWEEIWDLIFPLKTAWFALIM